MQATLRAAQNIHQGLLVHFFKSRLKSIEWFGTGEVLQIFTRDMGEGEADCFCYPTGYKKLKFLVRLLNVDFSGWRVTEFSGVPTSKYFSSHFHSSNRFCDISDVPYPASSSIWYLPSREKDLQVRFI